MFKYCLCILFTIGKSEGLKEKLRSILAQLEFQYTIQQWVNKGVNFQQHLYVPEIHPETGDVFCEREDEAHVLKVQFPYYTTFCLITVLCMESGHFTTYFLVYNNLIGLGKTKSSPS